MTAAHLAAGLDVFRMVPLVFTVVGSVFVLTGLRTLLSHVALRRRARTSTGLVTGLRQEHGRDGELYHFPVVAFRTAEGRPVETRASVGTTWRHHRPGEQVAVSYDPHDPSRVYLGRGTAPVLLGAFLAAFGAVFAAVGAALLLVGGLPTWLAGGG